MEIESNVYSNSIKKVLDEFADIRIMNPRQVKIMRRRYIVTLNTSAPFSDNIEGH